MKHVKRYIPTTASTLKNHRSSSIMYLSEHMVKVFSLFVVVVAALNVVHTRQRQPFKPRRFVFKTLFLFYLNTPLAPPHTPLWTE
jgi:hypothetical protein